MQGLKRINKTSLTEDGTFEPGLVIEQQTTFHNVKKSQSMEFLLENNINFPSDNTSNKIVYSSSDGTVTTIQNNSATSIPKSKRVSTTAGVNFNSSLPLFCLKSFISQEQIYETSEKIKKI